MEKKEWITFPILGDRELGQRVHDRLIELGWKMASSSVLDNSTQGGFAVPWNSGNTAVYSATYARDVESLMEGRPGDYSHHLLGDIDKLFDTDCYKFGALDPHREYSTGGRRVVRSVPLF